MALISVIIPTHNRKLLLKRAIRSALKQSYTQIEIIVVDDASTDGTPEIVEAIMDDRVRYHYVRGGRGSNHARNVGIGLSRGAFIAFLDDDDEWLPRKLEKQLALFKADSNVGLVFTGTKVIFDDWHRHYDNLPSLGGNLKRAILVKNQIGSTSTVMVRKEVLDGSGAFDDTLGARQDHDLWIRICQQTRVAPVAEALVIYHNSLSHRQISNSTQKYQEATDYLNVKYAALYEKMTDEERTLKEKNDLWVLFTRALRNGEKKRARRYLQESSAAIGLMKKFLMWGMTLLDYRTLLKIRGRHKIG